MISGKSPHPLLFSILVLILFNGLQIRLVAIPYRSFTDSTLSQAYGYFSQNRFEQADTAYSASLRVNISRKNWKNAFEALYWKSILKLSLGDVESFKAILRQAESLHKQYLSSDEIVLSDIHFLKGHFERISGNLNKAVEHYRQTVFLRNKSGIYDSLLVKAFNNLGIVCNDLGYFEESENYYTQAIQVLEKNTGYNIYLSATLHYNLGSLLFNKGNIEQSITHVKQAESLFRRTPLARAELPAVYILYGNYYYLIDENDRALQFYKQALQMLQESTRDNTEELIIVHGNIGSLLNYAGREVEALPYLGGGLKIVETSGRHSEGIQIYYELGKCYSKLKKFESGKEVFEKALRLFRKNFSEQLPRLFTLLFEYGNFLSENNKLAEANKVYREALEIAIQVYGPNHHKIARVYNALAKNEEISGNYSLANQYFDQALFALYTKSTLRSNLSENDLKTENIKLIPLTVEILKGKGNILRLFYEKTGNIGMLEKSLNIYELAGEIIEKLRMGYLSEASKMDLTSREYETFDILLTGFVELYNKTKHPDILEKVFNFLEKGKASILLSALRNNEALQLGGLPESIHILDRKIKAGISYYEELLYEENKASHPNKDKINHWELALFQLKNQQDSLLKKLEKEYPEYYSLKYNQTIPNLRLCQKHLKKEEIIIEYALAENRFVSLLIGRDEIALYSCPTDSTLKSAIQAMYQQLSSPVFTDDPVIKFREYCQLSYFLYSVFILPHEGRIQGKKIFIIPDEDLAYLPFDVMIRTLPLDHKISYSELPYLLKSNPVSYSYSAALLIQSTSTKKRFTKKLLAIAPTYFLSKDSLKIHRNTRQRYRDNLYPIPGAREEAILITKMYRSRLLLDQEASETNFKRMAGDFDLLHLSMHTIIDNNNPLFSKLVFSGKSDSLEDGLLNTYEIYNLRLNCKLAVLSSCNSGSGQMQKGEGVMSLARAFIYAGCNSLVMSLWEVEDKASIGLMARFYKHLKTGIRKDEALRKSKLEYLQSADPLLAHPYFWSGFVVIGDDSKITPNRILWTGMFFFILLIGFFAILTFSRGCKIKQRLRKFPSQRK